MTQKKYQVFVSSTFRDLAEERQDAIKNILDLNHIPAGMELFPAADTNQLDYIKKVIDECDYYLLILGGRYGSLDEQGISFTEREYDYAVETGKVVLAFVHGQLESIPVSKSDTSSDARAALEQFRSKVRQGRLVQHWTTRENLEPKVLKALIHAFNNSPQTGWIRANTAASSDVLQRANEALEENAKLRAELTQLKSLSQIKIPDLAQLDDEFKFSFRYKIQSRAGTSYSSGFQTITWRQIFLALAVDLERSKPSSVIKTAFKRALQDSGRRLSGVMLSDKDASRIKVQLAALGLITYKVAQATEGGYFEFISLTPQGEGEMVRNLAVRKS